MDLHDLTLEYLEGLPKTILGEIPDLTGTRDIVGLIGPRRVGKTVTMLYNVKRLIKNGNQALYVSFDAPIEMGPRKLAEEVRRVYPRGEVYLFLDEVQEWENWDRNLRYLHDVGFRLVVSGSTSALSADRVPSKLRGRYVSFLVLPLSLGELVERGGTFIKRGELRRAYDLYKVWGGFPEVWLEKSLLKAEAILSTAFFRDMVDRCRVRRVELFKKVFRVVLSSYGNFVSVPKLTRLLKSLGIKVSPTTVLEYLRCMEEAFFIFTVPLYNHSQRRVETSPRKVYLVDPVFINFVSKPRDEGRLLENLVFVELLRRGYRPRYYVTKDGREVDFYVGDAVIEVSYEADEEHRKKLEKASKELGAEGTLITEENAADFLSEGRSHVTPFFTLPL